MTILQAIADKNLFAPFLGSSHVSWSAWFAALSAVYGLPVQRRDRAVVRECTGLVLRPLRSNGFSTALFLTGRRSGKSRMAAVIAAYEAALAGRERKLAKGEMGLVVVVSPTRAQSRVVHSYIRAIFDAPMLKAEIVAEMQTSFELRNGIRIEIATGDHKAVRGYTLLAAVIDELAFFGVGEEAKIKSDTELVRALRPGLATVGGKLIAITTPYARKGWCFRTYQRWYGNSTASTLVWNCPSRTMNPTLPQSVVDEALAEDLQAGKSEYLGEFRDDVCEFLPRSLIEALVVKGRRELLPRGGVNYHAFVDLSGGRSDDATLAVGHAEGRKAIVDKLCCYKPPFNPQDVIAQMAAVVRSYGIRRVTGDNYAAEFVRNAFVAQRIGYRKSEKPKSALYLELLPRLCSGEIELPDEERAIAQLAGLERRTRSGGKDVVDHAPGGHDDLANAIAGLAEALSHRRVVGAFGMGTVDSTGRGGNEEFRAMAARFGTARQVAAI